MFSAWRKTLLPGWSDSRGANIEQQLARSLDLQVIDPWTLEAMISG